MLDGFLAEDRHFGRGFQPESDPAAANSQHGDLNATADDEPLIRLSGQDQHGNPSPWVQQVIGHDAPGIGRRFFRKNARSEKDYRPPPAGRGGPAESGRGGKSVRLRYRFRPLDGPRWKRKSPDCAMMHDRGFAAQSTRRT
jgi:hypothetical protein